MRAYLIVPPGTGPSFSDVDAWVLDGRVGMPPSPSLRAAGEAIQGRINAVEDAALDCFAALAMTQRQNGTPSGGPGAPRLLMRVDEIEAPDLDASLAGIAAMRPDAIVLPARHGRDVAHLGARLAVLEAEHGLPDGGIGIVALVACAAGVLAAESFVGASHRLRGLGWDAGGLSRQLGMPLARTPADSASHPPPHPEVPQRSGGLEGGLQGSRAPLEPSFEAADAAPQDEGVGGTTGQHPDPWASSPVLAHARATVRLAAAAAGVEAIETAYLGDDADGFGRALAAARRDGFAAMFASDPGQARLIRAAT